MIHSECAAGIRPEAAVSSFQPMKYLSAILFSITILVSSAASAGTTTSAADHIEKGNMYLVQDRPFAAVEEFRTAIRLGAENPVLYRNLAIVLYDLGFLDEAAGLMEKALALSPYAVTFRMELGTIYLAQGKNDLAEKQFLTVLSKNPGYSDAYYYLGEKYFRDKDYDMAWMFARMAKLLGHHGTDVIERLKAVSTEPDVRPWEAMSDRIFIRQILVDSRKKAEDIISRISAGELFEDIASGMDARLDSSGGFLGHFSESELHPNISSAIRNQKLFGVPVIVKTELGYHIVQRVVPFDLAKWKQLVSYAGGRKTPSPITADNEGIVLAKAKNPSGTVESAPRAFKAVEHTTHYSTPDKKYPVYAGVFRSQKYARERLDRLRDIGLEGVIHAKNTKRGRLLVVLAGKYTTLEEAKKIGKMIADHGLEYYIPR
jgi:hypothetical protein